MLQDAGAVCDDTAATATASAGAGAKVATGDFDHEKSFAGHYINTLDAGHAVIVGSGSFPSELEKAPQVPPNFDMLVMLAAKPHRLRWLHIDFVTLHWAYFIVTSLITALAFWAASLNDYPVSFVDSLFFTVSAITEAGLNTVSLSKLNTFQQVILFLLICVGSVPPVTFVLVHVRKKAFDRRYGQLLRAVEEEISQDGFDHKSTGRRDSKITNVSFEASYRIYTEYRALVLLRWLVPAYFLSFQFFGCIGLGAWIAINSPDTTLVQGSNPWWVGIFFGGSAFNNSGMSVQDNNLMAFKNDAYLLLTVGLLILAGNTCYPVFLRGIIWALWKVLPQRLFSRTRETLRFLLDNPRDVYTHLFPARTTWKLFLSVVALNAIDWLAFEVLNINNEQVTNLSPVARVLDGLIQALAVRFGGFAVASISSLNIALLVLYVLMMYISAFPITMSVRSTNIYEPKVLSMAPEKEDPAYRRLMYSVLPDSVSAHISRQLSHDLWYLCVSVFLIMIIETSSFNRDPVTYSVFNVIFEVVSAYGTVGISTGLPDQNYSFCGGWHALSKLILVTVMLRGRHRGLPDVIDRAVMMPGAKLAEVPDDEQVPLAVAVSQVSGDSVGSDEMDQTSPDEIEGMGARPKKRRRSADDMV